MLSTYRRSVVQVINTSHHLLTKWLVFTHVYFANLYFSEIKITCKVLVIIKSLTGFSNTENLTDTFILCVMVLPGAVGGNNVLHE